MKGRGKVFILNETNFNHTHSLIDFTLSRSHTHILPGTEVGRSA